MHEKLDVNNLLIAVIFSALGIIIPVLFHLLGLGSIFMPMYIPLAVGAFLLTGTNAFLMGFATPLLSAIITGMPPFYPPIACIMMVQLAVFCFLISFLTHRFRARTLAAFGIAMIADRIILAAFYYYLAPVFSINSGLYTAYDLLKGLPGIIIMTIILPLVVPRSISLLRKHSLKLYEHRHEEINEP